MIDRKHLKTALNSWWITHPEERKYEDELAVVLAAQRYLESEEIETLDSMTFGAILVVDNFGTYSVIEENTEKGKPHNHAPQICGATVGEKPWYLNEDQWDATACGCHLSANHEGSHECEHLTQPKN